MKKQHFIEDMLKCGWRKDKYGHLQKDSFSVNKKTGEKTPKKMRCKLQATSCRIEVQVIYEKSDYMPERKEWVRIDGAYYKDIVGKECSIKVGRFTFIKEA